MTKYCSYFTIKISGGATQYTCYHCYNYYCYCCYYCQLSVAELSMGPFRVTQPNPTQYS